MPFPIHASCAAESTEGFLKDKLGLPLLSITMVTRELATVKCDLKSASIYRILSGLFVVNRTIREKALPWTP
jgi:hypothetical protein